MELETIIPGRLISLDVTLARAGFLAETSL
jgi:hypothetical protein